MPRRRALTAAVFALGVLLATSTASAQLGSFSGATVFPPVPIRGPIVFYPTLTLGTEYNDNVFLDNQRKRSDFILTLTPAAQLVLETATYRWAAGYSFTAEKYMDNSELDNVFQRQQLYVNGLQRIDPWLTLTLSEVFIESNNTNVVTLEGFAVGRQKARSNSFVPGLTWQFAPRTSLRAEFAYTIQRFDSATAIDSDVYRLTTDVNHDFTSRLTGIFGYEVRYIDVEGQLGMTTHTPRVGATYRFTPTVTGTVVVGPTVRVTRDETAVSPLVDASLNSLHAWGSTTAYFSHYVGTAGGLGGSTENTSFGGLVQVVTLLRDLVLEAGPRYSISKSVGGGNALDVRSFALDLRATYRFTSWLSAVGGYRYFMQRSDSGSTGVARDVDQNRLFLGVQLGLPTKFD